MLHEAARTPGPASADHLRSRPRKAPAPRGRQQILALQRAAGNRAVAAICAPKRAEPAPALAAQQVQRSVGFEFELGSSRIWGLPPGVTQAGFWGLAGGIAQSLGGYSLEEAAKKPKREDEATWKKWVRSLKKGEPWARGGGVEFQADELGSDSDIELVTDPFAETPGDRGRLEQSLGVMEAFFPAWNRVASKVSSGDNGRRVTGKDMDGQVPGLSITNPDVFFLLMSAKAKPQATVGIKLARLTDLMSQMFPTTGESGEQAQQRAPGRKMLTGLAATPKAGGGKDLDHKGEGPPQVEETDSIRSIMGGAPALAAGSIESFRARNKEAPPPSNELVSLLALVYAYLDMGRTGLVRSYAKTIAPVMARTDFATLFKLLDEKSRGYYSARNGEKWIELVSENKAYAWKDLGAAIYSSGIKESQEPNDWYVDLTRKDWLTRMAQGTDLLTKKSYPSARGKKEIEGLGSMGAKVDKTKGGDDAAIFELRALKEMDVKEWRAFALNLFDYVTAVNSGKDYTFVDKPPETDPPLPPPRKEPRSRAWLDI